MLTLQPFCMTGCITTYILVRYAEPFIYIVGKFNLFSVLSYIVYPFILPSEILFLLYIFIRYFLNIRFVKKILRFINSCIRSNIRLMNNTIFFDIDVIVYPLSTKAPVKVNDSLT